MRLLAQPLADWTEITSASEAGSEAERLFISRITQLLSAERLLVLTGLGTSTGIKNEDDASGPSMETLWDLTKAGTKEEAWKEALAAASWPADAPKDIELLLSRCQMAFALSGDTALESFIKKCEEQIVSACSFVSSKTPLPNHEMFLRRIARRPVRLPRTQIFTTNYDLAFETAAARTGFALIDGFSHVHPQRFNGSFFDVDYALRDRERAATPVEWMHNVFHLLKLHGSVDWTATDEGVARRLHPTSPLIIYPRASKFETSYQQPFLELMARFQGALRRPDTGLLIVGCGLNADQHVAEPILAAARSNVRLSIAVVSRNLSKQDSTAIAELQRLAKGGDRRITLVEADFEEFVPQLPDLVPETESELHQQRTDP